MTAAGEANSSGSEHVTVTTAPTLPDPLGEMMVFFAVRAEHCTETVVKIRFVCHQRRTVVSTFETTAKHCYRLQGMCRFIVLQF